MKARLGALLLFLALCLAGCSQAKVDGKQNMDKLLSIIADPKTDRQTLIQAIQQLGPVTEPASFWSAIANNAEYNQVARRWAVWELFRRHVEPDITLADLASVLDNPTWLADEAVSIVTVLGGRIPVKWTVEDTVFVLLVFPDLPNGPYKSWGVYLRVSGQVDRESFINVLRGQPVSAEVSNAQVLEYGLVPADPTKLDK
jgi:hypothetical protein